MQISFDVSLTKFTTKRYFQWNTIWLRSKSITFKRSWEKNLKKFLNFFENKRKIIDFFQNILISKKKTFCILKIFVENLFGKIFFDKNKQKLFISCLSNFQQFFFKTRKNAYLNFLTIKTKQPIKLFDF